MKPSCLTEEAMTACAAGYAGLGERLRVLLHTRICNSCAIQMQRHQLTAAILRQGYATPGGMEQASFRRWLVPALAVLAIAAAGAFIALTASAPYCEPPRPWKPAAQPIKPASRPLVPPGQMGPGHACNISSTA